MSGWHRERSVVFMEGSSKFGIIDGFDKNVVRVVEVVSGANTVSIVLASDFVRATSL